MDDLFGISPLAGLATGPDAVSRAEEDELVARIDDAGLAPFAFQGWLGKRMTRSYGAGYDFTSGRPALGEAIPAWLEPLRAVAAAFAEVAADDLVQALVIRYDPGAGIGWHRDRPHFGHVIGISLGAPAAMRFRQRTASGFARVTVPLASRAMYHLSGAARHEWEHSIAPLDARRWSVTFRSLAQS